MINEGRYDEPYIGLSLLSRWRTVSVILYMDTGGARQISLVCLTCWLNCAGCMTALCLLEVAGALFSQIRQHVGHLVEDAQGIKVDSSRPVVEQ